MTLPRLFMMAGMTLPLIGLIYGMSLHGETSGMTVELTCLVLGACIFLLARQFEKKHSG